MPFVNNYGVWKDEFRELGLESTLDVTWDDAMCYFGEDREVRVGRGYGRWNHLHNIGSLCIQQTLYPCAPFPVSVLMQSRQQWEWS